MGKTGKTKLRRRVGPFTYDDFCALIREDQKADLLDGVIYIASPENTDANELFMWLSGLMHDFAEVHDLGKVYGSRVACRLDDKNAPEPDIVYVSNSRLDRVHRGGIEGSGDLAVEIVSPDSVERDYETKREKYERAGFREYWIIDEHEEQVILLRLTGRKKYREVRPKRGVLISEVLEGFWLRPEWLWQDPRPKKTEILATILKGPPA
ncbi:MAG TPA: Uma2 family endonuclease [Gemmataceae bacterium]|jgi:Uma2 family endonuclease|nr:Uma2 family endonuclease [Gemmataceae bacterium]